jgi:Na+-transporting NADH:ubiquinone oxidoreductase subunit D
MFIVIVRIWKPEQVEEAEIPVMKPQSKGMVHGGGHHGTLC